VPRLVLLRHAEAEQHSSDDRSRVLVERGRADAAATRALMISLAPDVALVSTAARTRETWQLAGPGGVEVVLDERLYEASAADLREVLGEQSAACVVLVGHNPSLERLAWELEDNDDTNRGLRPCGVGVFEVRDWTLSGARLTRWG
jgi:phosphohistidine phosphatase